MTEAAIGFGVTLALALIIPRYMERKHRETTGKWYHTHIRENLWMAPPVITFPIIWTILYIFIATAIGIWSIKPEPEMSGSNYIATWVLIGFNITFLNLWTLIFFSYRDKKWSLPLAFADAIFLFGTALAIGILFHLSSETNVAVFVLWWLYVIWTLFAMTLSLVIWLCNREGGLGIDYSPVSYNVAVDL